MSEQNLERIQNGNSTISALCSVGADLIHIIQEFPDNQEYREHMMDILAKLILMSLRESSLTALEVEQTKDKLGDYGGKRHL